MKRSSCTEEPRLCLILFFGVLRSPFQTRSYRRPSLSGLRVVGATVRPRTPFRQRVGLTRTRSRAIVPYSYRGCSGGRPVRAPRHWRGLRRRRTDECPAGGPAPACSASAASATYHQLTVPKRARSCAGDPNAGAEVKTVSGQAADRQHPCATCVPRWPATRPPRPQCRSPCHPHSPEEQQRAQH